MSKKTKSKSLSASRSRVGPRVEPDAAMHLEQVPLMLAAVARSVHTPELSDDAVLLMTRQGQAMAKKLLATFPIDSDDIVEAVQRVGDRSCYVQDARRDHGVDPEALALASVGYIYPALNLGLALMYLILRDQRSGVGP